MSATPDTSPANVAKVLREASDVATYLAGKEVHEPSIFVAQGQAVRFRALADALEQHAAAPDPKRFAGLVTIGGEALMSMFPRTFSTPEPMGARPVAEMYAATVLAAAFPELAPSDDALNYGPPTASYFQRPTDD